MSEVRVQSEAVIEAAPRAACTCPVCETAANGGADYFARAFGDARRFAATAEAVVDALGFCPRHGAALLAQEGLSRGIVRVFRKVVPELMPLLREEHVRVEKYQQMFFAARTACPACAHEERIVGRHIARLARQFSPAPEALSVMDELCAAHAQHLAEALKAAPRLRALAHYVDGMDEAARAMDELRAEGDRDADREAKLAHALRLVAGRSLPEPTHDDDALAEALQRCPTLAAGLGDAQACPLCIERARARQRWLQHVPRSARHAQDAWLFYPTCPEHVAAAAQLGDPDLTAAVATRALHAVGRQLRQQVLVLAREADIRAAAAAARAAQRYKYARTRVPKPPHLLTPKPAAPQAVKCPWCERLGIAEAHARVRFLDLLENDRHRSAYAQGYGLCMKHFAEVYVIAPRGAVRSVLAETQRDRLALFARLLDAVVHRHAEGEPAVSEAAPWRLELQRFCGFI